MSLISRSGLSSAGFERLPGRAGGHDFRAALSDPDPEQLPRIGLVVDHEHLQPVQSFGTLIGGERISGRRVHAPLEITLLIDRDYRQLHHESRPPAFARAVGLHRPAVQLYQVAHYRQSQAEPAVLARRLLVGLPEPLEDLRQELRVDP
jgi:hypothetical protein